MAKTIKQIADELGIDKQKVYRFIVKNHITASGEVKQSKVYDDVAERLIKSHFNHITTSSERCGESHQKSSYDVVLEQLIKELESKNMQINILMQENKELQDKLLELSGQVGSTLAAITQGQLADKLIQGQQLMGEAAITQETGKSPKWMFWRKRGNGNE